MPLAFEVRVYEYQADPTAIALREINETKHRSAGVPDLLLQHLAAARDSLVGIPSPGRAGDEIYIRDRHAIAVRLLTALEAELQPTYSGTYDGKSTTFHVHFRYASKTGKVKWDPKDIGVSVPVSHSHNPLDVAFFVAIEV